MTHAGKSPHKVRAHGQDLSARPHECKFLKRHQPVTTRTAPPTFKKTSKTLGETPICCVMAWA